MDNLILDADSLFAIADVIGGYCAKQRETLNVYYAQIMALESEWRDDETFGAIAEEINKLKTHAIFALDEINEVYPKYFREKARLILSRPTMQSTGGNESYGVIGGTILNQRGATDGYNEGNRSSTPLDQTSNVLTARVGGIPNSFASTRQNWHQSNPYTKVFNSPKETGSFLNCNQGVPVLMGGEGIEGFRGTCGLVCCENILRMAGVHITESDIITYAMTNKRGMRYLCTVDQDPNSNGGTYAEDRQAILSHFGIESKVEYSTNLEEIAGYVAEGRGVIASVDAYSLWYGSPTTVPAWHAITITSVERDVYTNEILGFYICDSGSGNMDSARKVSAEWFASALQVTGGELNITESIIR